MYRVLYFFLLLAAFPVGHSSAQGANAEDRAEQITFRRFLDEVLASNLDYAAERYNVSIAEAGRAAAKVFPNPQFELGQSRDVTHHGSERMPEIKSIAVTQTFELGGKRAARRRVADFNARVAAATLDEFLRNLRLDAAAAFAETLAAQQVYEQKRRAAGILDDLLAANEQRLRVGEIGEVDLVQTRVEARQLRSEALASEADLRAMRIALNTFLGRDRAGASLIALGRLEQPPRDYDPQRLQSQMLANRSDLVALRHACDSAGAAIELARAGRYPDLDIGVGVTRAEQSFNSVAPSPKFDALGIRFALPIPLFNRNSAEISIASLRFGQAERQLEAAEHTAEIDLRSAYERNRLAADRVALFLGGALEDANQVLQAKRYSYERGQTTLLDLLEAQRASNQVYLSYYEALSERAAALIALERAAGLWDIEF